MEIEQESQEILEKTQALALLEKQTLGNLITQGLEALSKCLNPKVEASP